MQYFGSRVAEPSSEFLKNLQQKMRSILPTPPNYHNNQIVHVPKHLAKTGWVYVRVDRHTTPLQRPYTGPHKIIEAKDKFFILDINGKPDSVSVDRLKVAYGFF